MVRLAAPFAEYDVEWKGYPPPPPPGVSCDDELFLFLRRRLLSLLIQPLHFAHLPTQARHGARDPTCAGLLIVYEVTISRRETFCIPATAKPSLPASCGSVSRLTSTPPPVYVSFFYLLPPARAWCQQINLSVLTYC